jgi:hypothetical protein
MIKIVFLYFFCFVFLSDCFKPLKRNQTPPYSLRIENVRELKKILFNDKFKFIFTTNSNFSEVKCSHFRKEMEFLAYIKNAFISEFENANLYSESSEHIFLFTIDSMQLNSDFFDPEWEVALTINYDKNKQFRIHKVYKFGGTSYKNYHFCYIANWEFMDLIQNLIHSFILSREFNEYINEVNSIKK